MISHIFEYMHHVSATCCAELHATTTRHEAMLPLPLPSYSSTLHHEMNTSNNTVKTRICIISDTHSQSPYPADDASHRFREPLPKADILLHCGDLTYTGDINEHEQTLAVVQNVEAEFKLVIAGNHDLTLDQPFYKKHWRRWHGRIQDVERARDLWTGEAARQAGIVYLEEGVRTFELKNGARFSVCSPLLVGRAS